MHLVNLLEQSAKEFSWRKCFNSSTESLSYRALNKKSDQLAQGLKLKLGIKRCDKVALLLTNSPEFIIAFFAILKAGACCIPINTFLTYNEIKYILKDSQAKLLISSTEFSQILDKIAQDKKRELIDFTRLENVILTDQDKHPFLYWPTIFLNSPLSKDSSIVGASGWDRHGHQGCRCQYAAESLWWKEWMLSGI